MLAYARWNSGEITLALYDPRNGVNMPLLNNIEKQFRFSADKRLAFSANYEGDVEVYVLDTSTPDSLPVNISQNPDTTELLLGWSHDGHYLAFESYENEQDKLIYVWDGETTINITPDTINYFADRYEVAWSFDNRLAFAFAGGDYSEIYLWDEKTTVSLSQNPTGGDYAPVWNDDGQLVFQSSRAGEADIFVWDGVSLKNGLPDKSTFVNVAPELSGFLSYPTWTSEGGVAFSSFTAQEQGAQVYVWNGQTAINISQNPFENNTTGTWSRDGRWAFPTYYFESKLYVRDSENRPLLSTQGQYPPSWSVSGYLMFCNYERPEWVLSIWDGETITEVTRANEILAQWQGGSNVVWCSSG
jgi:Tol biopolymer transport system component